MRLPGKIRVAVVLGDRSTLIDFAGPWQVFADAIDPKTNEAAFDVYSVAASLATMDVDGGNLRLAAVHTFRTAPAPNVIVIGAQRASAQTYAWLSTAGASAHVILSVCTGAFVLAAAGLLDGLSAATHHCFYDDFRKRFPGVTLVTGTRFVDNGRIMTAGGLTSGIDAALRVVERYLGDAGASEVAQFMEFARNTPLPNVAAARPQMRS